MNDWRSVLDNPLTKVRTFMRFDSDGRMEFRDVMTAEHANQLGDQVAERRADLEPDWRHRLRCSTQNHQTHIATIPAVIVNQLMRDGIWGDAKAMEKWLNNPENKMWRTGGGHVKIKEA